MWQVLLALLVILGIVLFSQRALLLRLKTFADMRKPGQLATSFRSIGLKLDSHVVSRAVQPCPLDRAAHAFDLPDAFVSEGVQVSTDEFLLSTGATGMVVLHRGQVVLERYAQGMRPGDIQMSFSVTKSITSTAVGLAIRDGLIQSVDDQVSWYLPELKGSGYDGVTLGDCLEMASATDFQEDYEVGKPSDMPKFQKHFALKKPFIDFMVNIGRHPDRTIGRFNGYSSIDAQAAGMCVSAALQDCSLAEYVSRELWQPLGAEDDAYWLVDGAGIEMGAGGFCASARDLAKFGQLFLQKGRWGDRQVLPESWVYQATSPHAPHLMPGLRDDCLKPWGYGYLWWTPEFRYGSDYFASGIYNNYVYVNPEKQVVIANLAANEDFMTRPEQYKLNYVDLFQTIAKALP